MIKGNPVYVFVDDVRDPPTNDWVVCRTYQQAVDCFNIMHDQIEVMSLDHDLGEERTGYDFLLYVVEQYFPNKVPFKCRVHSANPVGAERMNGVINRYFDI